MFTIYNWRFVLCSRLHYENCKSLVLTEQASEYKMDMSKPEYLCSTECRKQKEVHFIHCLLQRKKKAAFNSAAHWPFCPREGAVQKVFQGQRRAQNGRSVDGFSVSRAHACLRKSWHWKLLVVGFHICVFSFLLCSSLGNLFVQWLNGQHTGVEDPVVCPSKPFLFPSYNSFQKDWPSILAKSKSNSKSRFNNCN